ncbi:MAG: hypothetical protein KDB82_18195, partial [Planctomycetes bacterium]|nr:hypothetical protein [Planctomycetota bacterium]
TPASRPGFLPEPFGPQYLCWMDKLTGRENTQAAWNPLRSGLHLFWFYCLPAAWGGSFPFFGRLG